MFNTLERIRWISASVVFFGHIRSLLFPPLNDIASPSVFEYFLYFITGFSHQAVIVFFVVSGFLVAKPLMDRNSINSKQLLKYYWRRFIRIYPAFVTALLLSIILLWLTRSQTLSLKIITTIFFNLGELFSIRLENNLPLWSLSYEWIYYIIFPLIFFFSKNLTRLIIITLFSLYLLILNPQLLVYSIFWLSGALVKSNFLYKIKNHLSFILILNLSLITLLILRLFLRGEFNFTQFLFNSIFCMTVVYLIDHVINKNIKLYKIEKILSQSSYSLYIIHYPIILSIDSFNTSIFIKIFIIVFVVYLSSYLLYHSIERYFLKFKNIIK